MSTASNKNIPSRKDKTDSANDACLKNNPNDQEYLDKLKIPTASRIIDDNRQCKPCIPKKTMWNPTVQE